MSDVGVIRSVPVRTEKMSEDLRSRVKELETTVDALTDEIVDLQKRLDEVENEEEYEDRDEVGVGIEDDGEDNDMYVA
jgi:predicted  nucleic acid-binding Zn-ribbon protein